VTIVESQFESCDVCVPHMVAGEQRPGSPGSPRNGSGSAEDDDADDDVDQRGR
jgi:hypothetical protein